MRIVIVTGESPHHKHLCVRLARQHDVVGIFHPGSHGAAGQFTRLRKWAKNYGWPLATLSAAAAAPAIISGWSMKRELAKVGERFYGSFTTEYEQFDKAIVHRDVNVRSADTHELLRRLDPDVTVVLGGPFYPPEFIASCRLVLNFHSGISPIYNGSSTICFAYANGHPHLCGGTLMVMSPVIDGGTILAHYLPSVEAGDGPASLFMKTVGGAATLYERFLSDYSADSDPRSIPQNPPLFYYRYVDWSLYQSQRVAHRLRKGVGKKFQRPEQFVEYWNAPTDQDARDRYESTIRQLLWNKPE